MTSQQTLRILLATTAIGLFSYDANALVVSAEEEINELVRALNFGAGIGELSASGVTITDATLSYGQPGFAEGGGEGGFGYADTLLGVVGPWSGDPLSGNPLTGSLDTSSVDDNSSPLGDGFGSALYGTVDTNGNINLAVTGFGNDDFGQADYDSEQAPMGYGPSGYPVVLNPPGGGYDDMGHTENGGYDLLIYTGTEVEALQQSTPDPANLTKSDLAGLDPVIWDGGYLGSYSDYYDGEGGAEALGDGGAGAAEGAPDYWNTNIHSYDGSSLGGEGPIVEEFGGDAIVPLDGDIPPPDGEDAPFFESGDTFLAVIDNYGPSGSQTGVYTNESGTYNLPTTGGGTEYDGIVLSTGDVEDYGDGPTNGNGSTAWGTEATQEQTDLLDQISGSGSTYFDTVQLDLTFTTAPGFDTLTFLGAFGSNEFPDFQDSQFLDGFGIFVNGQNIAGVNGETITITHPDMTEGIPGTDLTGVLAPDGDPLLRFDVDLVALQQQGFGPNEGGEHSLTIILSDRGDDIVDTTAYLSTLGSAGAHEGTPLFPDNTEYDQGGNPTYNFDIPVIDPDTTVWFDPDVAIGYTFESDGAFFATVTMPDFATVPDSDGYILKFWDEVEDKYIEIAIGTGDSFSFLDYFQGYIDQQLIDDYSAVGIDLFEVLGIDVSLMLDPDDELAFSAGMSFISDGSQLSPTMSMTPITVFVDPGQVPEPGTLALLGSGLVGIAWMRRRRQTTAV